MSFTHRPAAPLQSEPQWTEEADVVVIGYGVAGASAAVEAASHGSDVLIVERGSGWGGAAAQSGGIIYMGGGTSLQNACGVEDTPEAMEAYITASMGPGGDADKIAVYCHESTDHYDWLVANGVEFEPTVYEGIGAVPENGEGLMYSGGENAWPFNEIAKPAPRGHLPKLPPGEARVGNMMAAVEGHDTQAERGRGYWLMEPLAKRCAALGVREEYDFRADRLIVDTDGRVCGVHGVRYGKEVNFRAKRGVVLAGGSFIFNSDMVARFAPHLLDKPGSATEAHDGHCIRMAQALGADLGRMDGCQVAGGTDSYMTRFGILVDEFGQRFVTEDTYGGRVSQMVRFRANDKAFLVLDDDVYESAPVAANGVKPTPTWVADTVEELESEMGLPEGSLVATVALYNRHAAEQRDPVFRKNPKWVKPLTAPFGAIDISNRSMGFTLGGLRTSTSGEVLHVDRRPIPGLYAAGRCTSGIAVWGYASGMSLGDGSFFGRRAGRAAAASVS